MRLPFWWMPPAATISDAGRCFQTRRLKRKGRTGRLVVSCRVGQYEAIRSVLKSWIPNILILAPEDFKMSLLKDMKQWIKRQEDL